MIQKNQWNYNKNKVNANKQEDIVILEYSVEEDTLSNHQMQNIQNKPDVFRQHSKSEALRAPSASKYIPG